MKPWADEQVHKGVAQGRLRGIQLEVCCQGQYGARLEAVDRRCGAQLDARATVAQRAVDGKELGLYASYAHRWSCAGRHTRR